MEALLFFLFIVFIRIIGAVCVTVVGSRLI